MKTSPLALLALALAACVPAATSPPPPDDPDAGDYPPGDSPVVVEVDGTPAAAASPCGLACANIKFLTCPEGDPSRGVSCYRGCLSQATHERVPTKCWAAAKTIPALRACGGIRCLAR